MPEGDAPALAGHRRTRWAELPGPVRQWVEELLGSPVVAANTARGGFSPGAACRLRTADGRGTFLKAVSDAMNPFSVDLHRREAEVTRHLRGDPAVPELLGAYDDGTWVGLLLEAVDGRPPAQPWRRAEVGQVLRHLTALHDRFTPARLPGLVSVENRYGDALCGWRRLAAQPPSDLHGWAGRHLDRLAELEARWATAAAGESLLHADLRVDNLLLTSTGVVFVDWPWACAGAAWVDVVALAPSVAAQGGPDPEWLLARTPSARGADPDAITAVAAAVAGYFAEQVRRPPPPGLRNPRVHREGQAHAALAWVQTRTDWA